MTTFLAPEVSQIIKNADRNREQFGHPFITTDDILLALSQTHPALINEACNSDKAAALGADIERRWAGAKKFVMGSSFGMSDEVMSVLRRAAASHVMDRDVTARDILKSLLEEKKCKAAGILKDFGAQLENLPIEPLAQTRREAGIFPQP